jgi:hypothetical protein
MKKIALILLVLSVLLAGCIKYQEEMWIKEDGSGTLTMKVSMPDMGFGEQADTSADIDFQDKPGVRLINKKQYKEEDMTVYEMEVEFDFVDSLSQLKEGEGAEDYQFIGDIELFMDENDNIIFNRLIQFEQEETGVEESPGSPGDEMGEQMFNSMFAQYNWEYIVHFPYKIISANANEENIDRESNTVKWVFPLSELQNEKMMTATMEYSASSPTKGIVMIAIVGIVGLILVVIIAIVILKLVKKKNA